MTPEEHADALVHVEPVDPTDADGIHHYDLALVSTCGGVPTIAGRRKFTELRDAIVREINDARDVTASVARENFWRDMPLV
jgi:hypothetical protein